MTPLVIANLTDDQARQLEGDARDFYRRVLILMNESGCDVQTAIRACEEADKNQNGRRALASRSNP